MCDLSRAVAHLRERQAELRRPAERVDLRRDVPDGVPRAVLVAVVVDRLIHLHAGGVHAELVAGTPVAIRVDEQPDHVARRERVAPLEQLDDAVGVRIVRAHEHVQVRRVVGDLRLGLEAGARLTALGGAPHPERRDRRRVAPDGILVDAVDRDGALGPRRDDSGVGGRRCWPANVRRGRSSALRHHGRVGGLQRQGEPQKGDDTNHGGASRWEEKKGVNRVERRWDTLRPQMVGEFPPIESFLSEIDAFSSRC